MRKAMSYIGAVAFIAFLAIYFAIGIWNVGVWAIGYLLSGGRVGP